MIAMLVWVAVGAAAGWIAGQAAMGSGFGLIDYIVVGILGSAVGSTLFQWFGLVIAPGIMALSSTPC